MNISSISLYFKEILYHKKEARFTRASSVMLVGLKKNDVVSRYAGCFFVLLNDLAGEDAERVALRLKESWKKSESSGGITASYEFERI